MGTRCRVLKRIEKGRGPQMLDAQTHHGDQVELVFGIERLRPHREWKLRTACKSVACSLATSRSRSDRNAVSRDPVI